MGSQLAIVINIQPCMHHSRSSNKMSSALLKMNMNCPIYVTVRFKVTVSTIFFIIFKLDNLKIR